MIAVAITGPHADIGSAPSSSILVARCSFEKSPKTLTAINLDPPQPRCQISAALTYGPVYFLHIWLVSSIENYFSREVIITMSSASVARSTYTAKVGSTCVPTGKANTSPCRNRTVTPQCFKKARLILRKSDVSTV